MREFETTSSVGIEEEKLYEAAAAVCVLAAVGRAARALLLTWRASLWFQAPRRECGQGTEGGDGENTHLVGHGGARLHDDKHGGARWRPRSSVVIGSSKLSRPHSRRCCRAHAYYEHMRIHTYIHTYIQIRQGDITRSQSALKRCPARTRRVPPAPAPSGRTRRRSSARCRDARG